MNRAAAPASLRARLLTPLLLATLLVWGMAGVVSYLKARHEAGELLDGQLAQSSKLLMAQAEHEMEDLAEVTALVEEVVDRVDHPYEQPLEFQIWGADGRLLLKSNDAPSVPLSRADGYSDIRHAGKPWRMFSIWSPDHRFQVQVAEPLAGREQVALDVAMQVGLPIILVLPLIALVIFWAVRHALRPMEELAGTVATRTVTNLTPLQTEGLPREVLSLATALNRLLERLYHALDSERRFTADAAHELRTPLAAIQIQAQVALASQKEEGRAHALEQVLAGTRRATRLVEQLLRLARLDPLAGLPATQPIELAALARLVVEDLHLGSQAERLQVEVMDNASVAGDPDLLRVALRNLLDNALRYSPPGSRITLGASLENGAPRLWVDDNGPGVAKEELPRLTERFYRGSEVTQGGSGLGLAIAARIAQLHGARLILENRVEGGLRAMLTWRVA
ncbi:MAG: sensor histidine kinase N-terminal domain-containing protein [Gallionellaceae bacterium]|nr:sensor histidine kinase N-terminal domain-containing protein [Gallionellaceae bacterium]